MKQKRAVIIGLDGVPFDLLNSLSERGIMPNTRRVIAGGICRRMESSLPEVSSVAWSSIITGQNPAGHGIFGFTDLFPNSYKLKFPNFNDLKLRPFWDSMTGKAVIINVPSTYPVKEMNGVHISGFISIDLEKSVYPKSLLPKLKELNYRLDVDSKKAQDSIELFLSDLDATLAARIKSYRYLWDSQDWQVFMLVFTGTDRLMHFLWDAYEDSDHQYHRDFLEYFHKIDEIIGEIYKKINDNDLFIMLSDHGFEKLNKEVHINYILKKEGFLAFKDKEVELGNIDCSTKAFALDPARIYINLKGKYPYGGVDQRDKGRVLRDIEDLFSSLEIDNKKVIRNTYRKEDVYSGPFLEQAPDLVAVGNQGFNLKANLKADKLTDKTIFTGKHTKEGAFLLLKGVPDESFIPDNPTVYDVRAIFEKAMFS